jgi:hypothetical protein
VLADASIPHISIPNYEKKSDEGDKRMHLKWHPMKDCVRIKKRLEG